MIFKICALALLFTWPTYLVESWFYKQKRNVFKGSEVLYGCSKERIEIY